MELFFTAERRLRSRAIETMEADELAFVSRLLDRVAKTGPTPQYRAVAERKLGEIALARGDKRAALARFRTALSLDPKVGVTRLAARLEKELVS